MTSPISKSAVIYLYSTRHSCFGWFWSNFHLVGKQLVILFKFVVKLVMFCIVVSFLPSVWIGILKSNSGPRVVGPPPIGV